MFPVSVMPLQCFWHYYDICSCICYLLINREWISVSINLSYLKWPTWQARHHSRCQCKRREAVKYVDLRVVTANTPKLSIQDRCACEGLAGAAEIKLKHQRQGRQQQRCCHHSTFLETIRPQNHKHSTLILDWWFWRIRRYYSEVHIYQDYRYSAKNIRFIIYPNELS